MKRLWTVFVLAAVIAGLVSGCAEPQIMVDTEGNYILALIPAENADREALEAGAEKAAAEFGIGMVNLLDPEEGAEEETAPAEPAAEPELPVSQADRIREAVASGYRLLAVMPDGTEETAAALQEAMDAGVKVVCVGASAECNADAFITEDHKTAGKLAGEALLTALEMKGIHEGSIGIINDSDSPESAQQREAGFREVFADTGYTLLETWYDEGSAAKAGIAAKKMIRLDAVGAFGAGTVSLETVGTAIREAAVDVVAVGCGVSDTVEELMEEGYVLAVTAPDYEAMGFDAVRAAAAIGKEETPEDSREPAVRLLKAEEQDVSAAAAGGDYKIALIGQDRLEQHWAAMEEGAARAAEELGCEVVNLSPVMRNAARQAEQILRAVEEGCHAIVIAVDSSEGVTDALREAYTAGVKIVYVDSPARIRAEVTYTTDNRAAGRKAGEAMLAELKAREIAEGIVSLIAANPKDPASSQREAGFREVFEGGSYTLQETRYSEGDAALAHALALEEISRNAVGIFAAGEAETVGVGNAIRERKVKTVAVGSGGSDTVLELIKNGHIHASVAREYDAMGYEGVKAACAALGGRNLRGAVADIGAAVLVK